MSPDPSRDPLAGSSTQTVAYTHIPKDQWTRFFDDFSKKNVDVLATAEIDTPDLGSHELAHESPLVGITASTEHGGRMTIEIILGDDPERYLSHTVQEPSRVTIGPASEDRLRWMEIESEQNGEVVTLRWREREEPASDQGQSKEPFRPKAPR